jgi:hypothetical protein
MNIVLVRKAHTRNWNQAVKYETKPILMGYLISKWIRGPILICMYYIVYKIFGSLLDLRSLLLICTGVCMPIDIVPNTKWVYTCVFCVCLWLSIYLLFIKNSFVKFFFFLSNYVRGSTLHAWEWIYVLIIFKELLQA